MEALLLLSLCAGATPEFRVVPGFVVTPGGGAPDVPRFEVVPGSTAPPAAAAAGPACPCPCRSGQPCECEECLDGQPPSYAALVVRARRERRRLVVFVGGTPQRAVTGCLTIWVPEFEGARPGLRLRRGIVVGVPDPAVGMSRHDLVDGADDAAILGVGAPPVPARSATVPGPSFVFQASPDNCVT